MPSAIRTQYDEHKIMTVTFDFPDRPVNTITRGVLDELDRLVGELEGAADPPDGVIFTSAKPGVFINGADLYEMREMDEPAQRDFLRRGQQVLHRISKLPMTTVAAINGHCLGGGLELALACDVRVAADVGSINIGVPEVKLGILPAWGGTTRLTRMLGLRLALPLLLTGKTLAPRKAMRLGIIDEVVRPEALVAAAHRLAHHPPRPKRMAAIDRAMHSLPPLRRKAMRYAGHKAQQTSFGNYPAVDEILHVVTVAAQDSIEAGLAAEVDAAERLMRTDACRNLMRLFFLRQGAKRAVRGPEDRHVEPVHHAAVIGGGQMGAGITHALIRTGIPVRLVESGPAEMTAALRRVHDLLTADQRAKLISPLESAQALRRVSPCTDWSGLKLADFVIEAVPEDIAIKHQVFKRLDELTRHDAVLASNTSSLSIHEIAEAVRDAGRVIGMHFFNPVSKMPLVEVVRTDVSHAQVMARGAELALRLGKTPVIVGDGPGFLVNRLLIPYLAEAMAMVGGSGGEGVPIERIDLAMKRWGMPMGPFELLDQVGLHVASSVFASIKLRLREPMPEPEGMSMALGRGWLGRHVGRGFYIYPAKRAWPWQGPRVNEELVRAMRGEAAGPGVTPDDQAIQWRLLVLMINQAVGALDEGVADDADQIDLATVLGLGLAPFRGGLMRFARDTGAAELRQTMTELAQRLGPRFSPHPALDRWVAEPTAQGRVTTTARMETTAAMTEDAAHARRAG